MNQREIELDITKQNWKYMTKNVTIMKLVRVYVRNEESKVKTLQLINWVRLFCKIVLPCELVSLTGDTETWAFT